MALVDYQNFELKSLLSEPNQFFWICFRHYAQKCHILVHV